MASHPTPADCSLAFGPNPDGRCEWDGAPIPSGRGRWCSVACRDAFDDAHLWTRARRAALRRAAGRCARCPTRGIVHVHHTEPVGDLGYGRGCQHHPDLLVVLCHDCHVNEHRNLRAEPGSQLALFRAA